MTQSLKLNLETKLIFGKHTGKTIEQVAYEDPDYIFFLDEKTDHVVEKDAVLLADENNQIKEID